MLDNELAKIQLQYITELEKVKANGDEKATFNFQMDFIKKYPIHLNYWKSWIIQQAAKVENAEEGQRRLEEKKLLIEIVREYANHVYHVEMFDVFDDLVEKEYIDAKEIFNIFYERRIIFMDPSMTFNFTDHMQIWGRLYILENYEEENEVVDKILVLYDTAFTSVSEDIKKTFEAYTSFITSYEDHELIRDRDLDLIKSSYQSQLKFEGEIRRWEKVLSDKNPSYQMFHEYVNYLQMKEFNIAAYGARRRMLYLFPFKDLLWLKIVDLLKKDRELTMARLMIEVGAQYCSTSIPILQSHLLLMETCEIPDNIIDGHWNKMVMIPTNAQDAISLFITYVYLLRRRIDKKANSEYTLIVEMYNRHVSHLTNVYGERFDADGDFHHKFAFFCYAKARDIETGRQQFRVLCTTLPHKTFAFNWLEFVRLERAYGEIHVAREIFKEAINHVVDDLYSITSSYVQFEREEGTLEQLDAAVAMANNAQQQSYKSRKKRAFDGDRPQMKGDYDCEVIHKKQKTRSDDHFQQKDILALRTPSVSPPLQQKSTPSPPVREKSVDKDGFVIPFLPPPRTPSPNMAAMNNKAANEAIANGTKKNTNFQYIQKPKTVKHVTSSPTEQSDKTTESVAKAEIKNDDVTMEAISTDDKKAEKSTGVKLYIKNIHFSTTSEILKETIEKGCEVQVTDVYIPRHINNGKPKGFAYVTVSSNEDSEKVLARGHNIMFEGRSIEVLIANPPRPGGKKLATTYEKDKSKYAMTKDSKNMASKASFDAPITTRRQKLMTPRSIIKNELDAASSSTMVSSKQEPMDTETIPTGSVMSNLDFKKFLSK
uniref:RRM domain-containing protein n=1 Tax=Rhabditophanes sp. KR3021 TaxID=114890 RepID=A0AC35U6W1_9BILA